MNFATMLIAVVALASIVGSAAAQDRMPPIPRDKMTEEQKKAEADVTAGPRGGMVGPFFPAIRDPEFMGYLQRLGAHLRFESAIPTKLNEFAILMTARRWTQQYEWNGHYQLALKAGWTPEALAAIAEGRRPNGLSEDEQIVYDFVTELHHNQSVSDATYDRAVKRFGEKGVVDLVGVTGYYTMLSMLMNVARTPLREGQKPSLAPFPH
jgi:4-carboxymuconolactone decarboxylase